MSQLYITHIVDLGNMRTAHLEKASKNDTPISSMGSPAQPAMVTVRTLVISIEGGLRHV